MNWLAANHVAPFMRVPLQLCSVSPDIPIMVIAADRSYGKTVKDQKWMVSSNNGKMAMAIDGNTL